MYTLKQFLIIQHGSHYQDSQMVISHDFFIDSVWSKSYAQYLL